MDLKRAGALMSFSNIVGALSAFIGVVLFTNFLSSSQIGAFFLIQAAIGVTDVLVDLGLRGALEKRISEGMDQGKAIAATGLIKLILLIPPIVVFLTFRGMLNSYFGEDLTIWFIILLLFQQVSKLLISILKGELRVSEAALLRLIRQISWPVVGIPLAMTGMGTLAPILGLMSGYLLVIPIGLFRIHWAISPPNKEITKSLVNYAKFHVFGDASWKLFNWTDLLILGWFVSPGLVAAYEIAWRVSSLVVLVSNAISSTIFPQLSAWSSDDQQQLISGTVNTSITFSLLLVVPALFGASFLSKEILLFGFGQEYVTAQVVLILLLLMRSVQGINSIFGKIVLALDHPDLSARAKVSSLIFNILLNIGLIPFIGIVGAAVAALISYTINTGMHLYYSKNLIKLDFPYLESISIIGAAAGMIVLLVLFQLIIPIESLYILGIFVFLGGCAYSTLIILIPLMRRIIFNSIPRFDIRR